MGHFHSNLAHRAVVNIELEEGRENLRYHPDSSGKWVGWKCDNNKENTNTQGFAMSSTLGVPIEFHNMFLPRMPIFFARA